MNYRCITIGLMTIALLQIQSFAVAAENNLNHPRVTAATALLIEAEKGTIFFDKQGEKRRHPASTTKILTGILAIERGRLNERVEVTSKSANVNIGSTINLKKGDSLTLGDLIKGALLNSANDTTVAIGEHIGGKGGVFLEMMNTKAILIGAVHSNFINTNGYSKPNHYTTGYDLATITRYAMKNPTFSMLVSTKESSIEIKNGQGKARVVNLRNTNRLLGQYPGVNGVKTGTTSAAGGCLITSAHNNQRKLISVILKSRSRYNDTVKLLDYGYKEIMDIIVIDKGEEWTSLPVSGGRSQQIMVVADSQLKVTLPKSLLNGVEKRVVLPSIVKAPVMKGQKLGVIQLVYKGKVIGQTVLIAEREVKSERFWAKLF